MKPWLILLIALAAITPNLSGQFDPEGAQVLTYFPHLADGGPTNQLWTTSLIFVNPHYTYTAGGTVYLYGNDGKPLSLDFGSGPVSSFSFTIPPQGTATFTSTGASSTILTGWAIVSSSLPLQSIVVFRYSTAGIPQVGIAAQATAASQVFRSPATPSTGVAIANPYGPSIQISISAIDANGKTLATIPLTIGSLGHTAFNVSQVFAGLPNSFRGSIQMSSATPATNFVAWTISSDGGTLSNYPPSGLGWPVSQYERIWKVWLKVLNVALFTYPQLNPPPSLAIDPTTSAINANADTAHNKVTIYMNLAELISDSESELSFVVAHELGHIIQAKVGLVFVPTNKEQDADQYGMLLSLMAGYDPYGAAGALAKLSMASGDAGLMSQFFDNLDAVVGVDLHGSFNTRLALIFQNMQSICASPQFQNFCAQYKSMMHPHLPTIAPLMPAR